MGIRDLGKSLVWVALLVMLLSIPAQAQKVVRELDLNIARQTGTARKMASAPSTPPGGAELRWKNGETIPGEIVSATPGALTWKTPLFEDPLQLGWPALERLSCNIESATPDAPFSVTLRDGSFLYGDLTSITAGTITLHSARLGDAVLKRSEVLAVDRLKGGDLLYAGPTGSAGWIDTTAQPGGNFAIGNSNTLTPALATGPGGALLIRNWNRAAHLDLKLPDSMMTEFRVRSSQRPDFALSFRSGSGKELWVETWDDTLVLVAGNQFKVIRKLDSDERVVDLRLGWDSKAFKASVFDAAGELLTTWQPPVEPTRPLSGLIVHNKGLDLTLESLRVHTWNGKAPAKIDPKQPRVELLDGQSTAGQVQSGDTKTISVQTASQLAPVAIPLEKIEAIVFSSDPPQVARREATLVYADGAILFGKIASIADGRINLTTTFADGLSTQVAGLRQLRIRVPAESKVPEPALTDLDKIVVDQITLHGKFEGTGDASPRWMPVGGIKTSRPSLNTASEIVRTLPADNAPPADPALFYLDSGDVLAGTLKSLDKTGAELESTLMAARKLSADELNAIQLSAPARMNVQGFDDAGWRIVKGDDKTVRRTTDTLEMDTGTVLAYPSLMQCSEIGFDSNAKGFSGTRLRLFCAGTDGSKSVNVLIGNTGNQFISGLEGAEGQFQTQSQIKIQYGQPVSVHLTVEENRVMLYANGLMQIEIPIDPAKRGGFGLIIEPASLWGNAVTPVALSHFSARSFPGRTWLPDVDGDVKTQALTVPRFQKDDLPRHLLLASNGDVLRGEVEAATDSHFGFRSGLENLNVPRDRIKAVIWLKPPIIATADTPAPAPAAPPPPSALDERIEGLSTFSNSPLGFFISHLLRKNSSLKYKYPDKTDPQQIDGRLGNETIRQALASICGLFHLSQRQDGDTIILESIPQPTTGSIDLVRKVFWLKPDAFSPTAPAQDTLTLRLARNSEPLAPPDAAQEILTRKGLTFPTGAFAFWQPKNRTLTMVNTAENQAKLMPLLDSDFGGSLGSPTHWLLLTSGARLALAVDQFAPDAVTGHNPAYGSCRVPMAQVYTIRTLAPEPTAAIKSVSDWRLVNAPDPVIPDSGGGNSPLLGKDAAGFKLPLLAGGDFVLEAEKGHVVVLDFWATWCGPCVKSLPGLIDALAAFPAEKVKLIGVNQGEASEQIKHFLETRNLKLTVALDADQAVGQKYGAEAIPQTVVIGPDGKVAWTQTGYNPDGEGEMAEVIKKLLGTN